MHFVNNGEQLLDYLRRADASLPALILLDLNMPRIDGREALREIKADPHLRHIPIVALTTSRAEEDIQRAYDLGVNSYIIKPAGYPELVAMLQMLSDYWFTTVKLPQSPNRRPS